MIDLWQALKTLNVRYTCLKAAKLEDANFDEQRKCDNVTLTISQIIRDIYTSFLLIEPKFGKVPASKLMHMALPDLFIMWDDGIIDRYGLPNEKLQSVRSTSYLAFLILMQENINHLIATYSGKEGTRHQRVRDLKAQFGGLGLPRLLDMANMAVRDCELAICITCMRKAKGRWAQFGII